MSEEDTSGDVGLYDFTALCTPHYDVLVKYAYRLLPGRDAAVRDLVQETFLRAVRTWPNWRPTVGEDPSGSARGWLHRILQNAFFDYSRHDTRTSRRLDDHRDEIVESTYGLEADHNIQVLSDGVGDEVRQAMSELDPDQRAVVARADFGGESYLTIADNLGIPLGTVMSRLHRGRKRLAASLGDYARLEYGISRKRLAEGTGTKIRRAPESDRTRAAALADVPAEPPKASSTEVGCGALDDLRVIPQTSDSDVTVDTE